MTISPTDMAAVKVTDLKTIHMRYEGEMNTYWDLTLNDGRTQNFYGYQSSPTYDSGYLHQDNKPLSDWLCELVGLLDIPHWDCETEAVDFDLRVRPNRSGKTVLCFIANIKVQHEDDSTTDYPEVIPVLVKI